MSLVSTLLMMMIALKGQVELQGDKLMRKAGH